MVYLILNAMPNKSWTRMERAVLSSFPFKPLSGIFGVLKMSDFTKQKFSHLSRVVRNIFLSGNLANGEKIFFKVIMLCKILLASAGHNLLKKVKKLFLKFFRIFVIYFYQNFLRILAILMFPKPVTLHLY